MPSLTKTLVVLAVAANGFLAPAPQRPATVLQAATIAAKDVSALRKASGSSRCKNAIKRRLQTGRAGRSDARCSPAVRHRDAVDATARYYNTHDNETQAPA